MVDTLKKAKSSRHKLQKARSKLEKEQGVFLEEWKRSLEGLAILGKMATNSYRMAVREMKEHLKGIIAGPDSSLNWHKVKAESDRRKFED